MSRTTGPRSGYPALFHQFSLNPLEYNCLNQLTDPDNEIRKIKLGDAELLSRYYLDNRDHFRAWEYRVDDEFHSVASWQERLSIRLQDQEEGLGIFILAVNDDNSQIIGNVSLSNIQLGAFRACYMGYGVSQEYEGRGVMTQLCSYAIKYAFEELRLNRIMANYMPGNKRSESLLRRLGFEREGLAKRYLKINGQWEDHVMTSLLNPDEI